MDELVGGDVFRFADWPVSAVPAAAAGVYSIWDGEELIYVGMSGRGASRDHIADAKRTGGRLGLWNRLNSHASGRRSGDQFCVYVCDRLVLVTLDRDDLKAIARGELLLDQLTRSYIRDRLSFRFTVTNDGAEALALENHARAGSLGSLPLLNGIGEPGA